MFNADTSGKQKVVSIYGSVLPVCALANETINDPTHIQQCVQERGKRTLLAQKHELVACGANSLCALSHLRGVASLDALTIILIDTSALSFNRAFRA